MSTHDAPTRPYPSPKGAPTTMTMALYLHDARGRLLQKRRCPVQLTDDGVVFTEATFPAVVIAGARGAIPVAAFALHPEGHPDHQLYELPAEPEA